MPPDPATQALLRSYEASVASMRGMATNSVSYPERESFLLELLHFAGWRLRDPTGLVDADPRRSQWRRAGRHGPESLPCGWDPLRARDALEPRHRPIRGDAMDEVNILDVDWRRLDEELDVIRWRTRRLLGIGYELERGGTARALARRHPRARAPDRKRLSARDCRPHRRLNPRRREGTSQRRRCSGCEAVAGDHLRRRPAGVVRGPRVSLDRCGDDRPVDEEEELSREGVGVGRRRPPAGQGPRGTR